MLAEMSSFGKLYFWNFGGRFEKSEVHTAQEKGEAASLLGVTPGRW